MNTDIDFDNNSDEDSFVDEDDFEESKIWKLKKYTNKI